MRHTGRLAAVALALLGSAGPLAAQEEVVSPPRPRALSAAALASSACRPYAAPSSISQPDGNLNTQLVMAPARFRIGDSTYVRNVYNGQYVAPVLRMNPSRALTVNVQNQMQALSEGDTSYRHTNQHYHGMIVTPIPPAGDNVTNVHIPQGGANLNRFPVPDYQSQGMMWYHPHPHGTTAAQVAGGLAGALIIGDLLASYPEYRGAAERILYVKDTRDGGRAYLNVNGNPCTLFTIRPGERQLWRIGNMTAGTWLNLKLGEDGRNYPFIVLALDGNHLTRPAKMDSVFISPGGRAEVIVIGGTGVWTNARFYTDSVALAYNSSGQVSRWNPRTDLGALTVVGTLDSMPSPRALAPETISEDPVLVDSIRRLITDTDVDTFTVRYHVVPGGLGLNGKLYDPSRLDRSVAVGRTQEWTLINETTFSHTFHIHQTDFVVTRINGVPQPDSVHLDNVHLGIHRRGGTGPWVGDTVVIRFKFTPIAAGPFVYHCHDLFHEDAGMMANVCVYDPAQGQNPGWCRQWFSGAQQASAGGASSGGHAAHRRE